MMFKLLSFAALLSFVAALQPSEFQSERVFALESGDGNFLTKVGSGDEATLAFQKVDPANKPEAQWKLVFDTDYGFEIMSNAENSRIMASSAGDVQIVPKGMPIIAIYTGKFYMESNAENTVSFRSAFNLFLTAAEQGAVSATGTAEQFKIRFMGDANSNPDLNKWSSFALKAVDGKFLKISQLNSFESAVVMETAQDVMGDTKAHWTINSIEGNGFVSLKSLSNGAELYPSLNIGDAVTTISPGQYKPGIYTRAVALVAKEDDEDKVAIKVNTDSDAFVTVDPNGVLVVGAQPKYFDVVPTTKPEATNIFAIEVQDGFLYEEDDGTLSVRKSAEVSVNARAQWQTKVISSNNGFSITNVATGSSLAVSSVVGQKAILLPPSGLSAGMSTVFYIVPGPTDSIKGLRSIWGSYLRVSSGKIRTSFWPSAFKVSAVEGSLDKFGQLGASKDNSSETESEPDLVVMLVSATVGAVAALFTTMIVFNLQRFRGDDNKEETGKQVTAKVDNMI